MKLPTPTPTRVHAVEAMRVETAKKFWTLFDLPLTLLVPSHLLTWTDDDVSRNQSAE